MWNKFRLRVRDRNVAKACNGEKLVDYTLGKIEPVEGSIAQSNGYGKNDTGAVRFRKLLAQRFNKERSRVLLVR